MASYPVTKLDPRGTRVTMLYDAASQLVSQRYPDGRRNTFAYDAVGNSTLMLDPTGRTTTTYSPRGEVSSVAHPGDKRISYSYDAVSRRQWMTEPDGGRFTYTHDAAGRLTGLVNPQDQRTSFTFDALGRHIGKELASGSITTQAYDPAGRLAGVTNRKSSGDVISSFAYAYDQAGNRTGVLEANGVRTSWSYDKTYQLTHEHRGGHFAFNVTYTYDPVGNRLIQEDSGDLTTYTYDAANQLLTEVGFLGCTTYSYDASGNRTEKDSPNGTTYYARDADNRLTAAEPPAGTVTMTYTATGQRLGKESPAETKRYLYDFKRLLAETDGDGLTDKLFTSTTDEYGDLVSQYHGDHSDYYAFDGLGTTEALLNDSETLLARFAHWAFGLAESGVDPDTPFTFVGRQNYYRDDELDLYLLGAGSFGGRHYDPAAGRFVCEDRLPDDVNTYRYARNNPVRLIDPNGSDLNDPTLGLKEVPAGLAYPSVAAQQGQIGDSEFQSRRNDIDKRFERIERNLAELAKPRTPSASTGAFAATLDAMEQHASDPE